MRFLKWVVIFVCSLLAFCFLYQMVVGNQIPTPPGKMIDVNGHKLHYYATGENVSGRPTVVLESGLGTPAPISDWSLVQPELSKYTRVISYDRAGYGWSEEDSKPRTVQRAVDDLHALLHQSGEKGPYLLVGHSYGGYIVRVYANEYPADVYGLVLVEASSENQPPNNTSMTSVYLDRFVRDSGILRVYGDFFPMTGDNKKHQEEMSPANFKNAELLMCKNLDNDTQVSEKMLMDSQHDLVRQADAHGFGNKPIEIITSGNHVAQEPQWLILQNQFEKLSTNSKHLIAQNSGHYVQLERPDVVSTAIEDELDLSNKTKSM